MIKDLQSLSLLDILPDNLLADEQVVAAAQALDAELQAVTKATIETLHLPRLDVLPEPVIDLLAWQWHVDYYEPLGMELETKRRLVKESIAWHRMKGTPAAVEAVVSAAFDTSEVKEWFEYGGAPYYFKIVTEDVNTDKDNLNRMRRAIASVKNTRSWLEKIEFLLHLTDTEVITEGSLLDTETNKFELYPWRGRYFNGSWNFTPPVMLDGGRLFNGEWCFDAVKDGKEDATHLPHWFMGEMLDGSWNFGMSSDSRKIFFNSLEVDPLTMLTPQFILPEYYMATLDFAGAGRLHDGTWRFGENGLDDTNLTTAELLKAEEHAELKETNPLMATEKVAENYPTPRMWRFNGAWTFGTATTFDGSEWFGGEFHFDGIPRIADPVVKPSLLNGGKAFTGGWTFGAPSPVVTFNANEDAGDNLAIEFNFTPMAETQPVAETEAVTTTLIPIDRMARMVFDGASTFDGWRYDGDYMESAGETMTMGIADQIQHADPFDGTNTFDGGTMCGADTGPREDTSITVTEGRWFNGLINFDGGNTVFFNGNHNFDGEVFCCLLGDARLHYDGAQAFDGVFRFKRAVETFSQYNYVA